MIGLGLSVVQIAVRQLLGFDPKSLFAASEQGAWYDPSDWSTLYQDSAGTTPVTAVEQPVGLILDKSKGLVLGPELVTNGDFSDGTTGWTTGAGVNAASISVVSGEVVLTTASTFGNARTSVPCVVGKTYKVSATARVGVSAQSFASIYMVNSSGGYVGPQDGTRSTSSEEVSFYFTATATTQYIAFGAGGLAATVGDTFIFDNISVRELPGNHATQTTATSRPVLSARYNLLTKTEQFDDAVWVGGAISGATRSAGSITITSSEGFGYVAQSVTLSAITYIVQCDVVCDQTVTNAPLRISFSTAAASQLVNLVAGVPQRITFTLTGIAAVNTLNFGVDARDAVVSGGSNLTGYTVTFNAASLVPANQASLPYQRVNTATDYDADPSKFKPYLRFDGVDDWLVTPTITPGTDKAQVFAGVRKLSDAAAFPVIVELGVRPVGGSFTIGGTATANTATYHFASQGTNQVVPVGSGYAAPITSVLTGIGDISGDSAILRVNGTQAASSTADQGTGNYGNYPLYIGRRGGTTLPFNGHLYGLIVRFGANLPAGTIASTESWVAGKTGITL